MIGIPSGWEEIVAFQCAYPVEEGEENFVDVATFYLTAPWFKGAWDCSHDWSLSTEDVA